MRKLFVVTSALALSIISARAQSNTNPIEPPSIVVSGTATASTVPDVVHLHIAVETRGANAQRTAGDNANAVAAVIAALRARLNAGSQITTASYSLSPNYSYPPQGGEPTLVGYVALNTLKVETADLNIVGALIDTSISAGANNINSITYGVRDQTKLRGDALGDAARQARSKAEALASAMGVRLGSIRHMAESTNYFGGISIRGGKSADQATTPIQSGPVEIAATVTITFDIAR